MMPKKDVPAEELELAETPKFAAVVEAEALAEQAMEATREIETAECELLADAAAARTKIEELEVIFREKLALRALGRITEKDVKTIRSEMADCRQKIEETPLALPAFKRLRATEGNKFQAARKVIEEYSMYHQNKKIMLREAYAGTGTFMQAKRLLVHLSRRLGDDAGADLERFVLGLKKVRPPEFWGLN